MEDEIKVKVTLRQIANSGCWQIFCSDYNMNKWCLNEGADDSFEVEISLEDANSYFRDINNGF